MKKALLYIARVFAIMTLIYIVSFYILNPEILMMRKIDVIINYFCETIVFPLLGFGAAVGFYMLGMYLGDD